MAAAAQSATLLRLLGARGRRARRGMLSHRRRLTTQNPDVVFGLSRVTPSMRRDPDVSPPSHVGHHVGRRVHALIAHLFTPEALFAGKAAVVVGGFSAFAFAPSTVQVFQTQRGLWVFVVRCNLFAVC